MGIFSRLKRWLISKNEESYPFEQLPDSHVLPKTGRIATFEKFWVKAKKLSIMQRLEEMAEQFG